MLARNLGTLERIGRRRLYPPRECESGIAITIYFTTRLPMPKHSLVTESHEYLVGDRDLIFRYLFTALSNALYMSEQLRPLLSMMKLVHSHIFLKSSFQAQESIADLLLLDAGPHFFVHSLVQWITDFYHAIHNSRRERAASPNIHVCSINRLLKIPHANIAQTLQLSSTPIKH